MRRSILIGGTVLAFVLVAVVMVRGTKVVQPTPLETEEINMFVGDQALHVAVADSNEERQMGLSGMQSLDPLDGMLFIFDEAGNHGMWMKDMHFTIDIIWIDDNLTVAGISEGLAPESFPEVFTPPHPVTYVLETEAGFAREYGITVGDSVQIER